MTTTISSASKGVETSAEASSAGAQPGRQHRSRIGKWATVTALSLLPLAAVVWGASAWSRSAGRVPAVNEFIVEPRTFAVVLTEKGELRAAKSTDIKCEVEGRSTIISLIEEGTAVQEGDLLVELASDEIEERIRETELKEANAITTYEAAKTELEIQRDKNASDIRKARLEIELKRLELEKYQKGEWYEKLRDAEIAIDRAKIMLERRKQDFEAAKELYARAFITQTEFEEDEFNHQKAIWDLEKAERAKDVLQQYTHVADSRRRQSDLEEAIKESERTKKNADAEETKRLRSLEGKEKELALIQDKLANLRAQKAGCRITAPTPGFVVYYSEHRRWGNDNQIKEGATVHERQILMQLPDTSKMVVVVRVHEGKTDRLALGQQAVVEVEGVPGRQFQGTVTKIAAVADTQNRWLNPDLKEYETEIMLEPVDLPLKPGVTAHVEIIVETVTDALAVPVQSVYARAGGRYVFRSAGRGTEYVEVRLGAIGTEWAELTSGLTSGDRILLAFSDEQTRLLPDVAGFGEPNGDGPPRRSFGEPPARPGADLNRQQPTRPGADAGRQRPAHKREAPASASRKGRGRHGQGRKPPTSERQRRNP